MRRLNDLFGVLIAALALVGCALLFAMMVMICADVGLRSLRVGAVPWANEVSEYILYVATFLSAPWLLRLGKHIRLDLVLRSLPKSVGWSVEWLVDLVGVATCATLALAGWRILLASQANGNIVIKTIAFTEWWLLIPIPATFLLLAIEFLFRMYRLTLGPRQLRDEATSAA
jgi:TRAP-type transport system small permease protein